MSKISLHLPRTTLTMPLPQFVWTVWCVLTYPLAWALGYYLYGWVGLAATVAYQALTFRGKL